MSIVGGNSKISKVFDWDRMTSLTVPIREKMKGRPRIADMIESERFRIGTSECQFFINAFDDKFYLKVWEWPDHKVFSVHAEKDEDFHNGIYSINMYFWFMKNIKFETDYLELQKVLFALT